MYSFPNLEPVRFPCPILTVAFWPAYRFLRSQVRCSGSPISLRIFQFIVIHTVKGFSIANETEVNVFLNLSCFVDDQTDVGNLISGFSAFSKSGLDIWKLSAHGLLKPGLENFEHYFLVCVGKALLFPFYCFPLFLCTDHGGRLSYLSLLFFGTLHSWIYLSFTLLPFTSLLFLSYL